MESTILATEEDVLRVKLAAASYREACRSFAEANHASYFETQPEVYVTDAAVQALMNEVIDRNAGDPQEIIFGCTHVLAMVIAQQPDAHHAADSIIGQMLELSLALRQRHNELIRAAEEGPKA